MMLLLPILTSFVTADRPPFTVTFTDKRAKELRVTITNIGNDDVYNISWLMYYPSSFEVLFGNNPNQIEGVIPHLAPGQSAILSTGPVFEFCLQGTIQFYIDGYCLLFGTKDFIGPWVVDTLLIPYEGGFSSTPDDLFFGVTNGTEEIRAFIDNTKDIYQTDVQWAIEFSCYPRNIKSMRFNGTIELIEPKERAYIGTGPIFGFHPWADIFVYVNGYGPAHGYQHIIGHQVIFPRYMPNHSLDRHTLCFPLS